MSGLSHTPGKRAWVYPHRGFESRLLRQMSIPYVAFLQYLLTVTAKVTAYSEWA